MNVSEVWPSRYVKAADLNGKTVTLTIKELRLEEMGHGAERERKAVLYFERATKCMVVNKTNGMIIAKLHGNETDLWAGKRIAIYGTRVRAFGQTHDVIRVREEIPPAPKAPQPGPGSAPVEEASEIDDENDVTDSDEPYGEVAPADADAALWEPDAALVQAATDAYSQLDALGDDLYGDKWEEVLAHNVSRISGGTTEEVTRLMPEQIQKLIGGMMKVKSQRAAAVQSTNGAKPVTNGAVVK